MADEIKPFEYQRRRGGAERIRLVILVTVIVVLTLTILSLLSNRVADAFAAPGPTPVTDASVGTGGWNKTVTKTDLHWMNVGGRMRPCRTATVRIHKWGVAILEDDIFKVWLRSTACISSPRPGTLFLSWKKYTTDQWGARGVDINVFANDSWGCAGDGCHQFGRRTQWKVVKSAVGFTSVWYPAITIEWTTDKTIANKLRLRTSVTCNSCG